MDVTTYASLRLAHPVVTPGDAALCVNLDQPVTALAVSAEGTVALGTHRGLISIHDPRTGAEQLALLGHRRRIHALSFSPDGRGLYSVARDGALRHWSLQTGTGVQIWQGPLSLNTVASDSRRLLVAGDDGVVRSFIGHQMEAELHGHRGMVTAAALLPDGMRGVSGGIDGVVILWELGGGRSRRLYRHEGAVTSCAVSADGRLLLSGGTDSRLHVWDIEAGRLIGVMKGHDGPVTCCAISGDGVHALSGSSDRTVMVWSLESGQRVHTFYSHEREVLSVAWGQGRVWSTSADRSARAWELSGQPASPAYRLRHVDAVTGCLFTADASQLISASRDYTLRVWDVRSGSCVQTLRGHHGAVQAAALSPGGRALASAANDGAVRLWWRDGSAWKPGLSWATGQGPISQCCFLDESLLLTSGQDGTVRAWSLVSGRLLFELPAHSTHAQGCAVMPGGLIVTASAREGLSVWSAGELLHRLPAPDEPVTACLVHPNGEEVLFGTMGGEVARWRPGADAATQIATHSGPVRGLTISGERLVSVGDDGLLKMHDLSVGGAESVQLSWPLSAVSAREGWLAVGDRAGNIWIFSEDRAAA